MSNSKVRQSVTLLNDSKAHLERIKSDTGVPTDNAAINDALHFRAKLSNRKIEDVIMALSFYDQIKPDILSGNALILENPKTPGFRTRIIVPGIG